ncbi:MAG: DUF805 domain-containing protein [Rhodomicrobium sp.]
MSAWHIQQDGQSKGPFSDEQMKALYEAGVLYASTLAWKGGYSSWMPLSETDFVYKSLLDPAPGRYQAARSAFGDLAVEKLSMWEYFTRAIGKKYATFSGRARRKEYWSFVLFYLLALSLIVTAGAAIDGASGHLNKPHPHPVVLVIFGGLFLLAMIIPHLAIFVRRLHDVGLSGWLVLVSIIPYVGGLFSLVIAFIPSEYATNKHGPCPKRIVA